ncbi:NAD(P)-dependent dehydrogenase (short-subunit alcohol dehydrogenase family) [Amycolatopsis endophytica]|uniref:NAD(P)-dependent dehydrogenase (Short-subunit alcohol dehydrogenase family) n=1 Tax=Amycolatopsis endophytica TaxID=860233 RepID=A0A853BCA6_9PSEU|nr:SDR family oxidoreductase [Amycolatopsis endophytica]NYI92301.1 NAD(P)-dependent dehydrogenase (short-subunit alcohol dehydrogenase family) [Amycolatopsis endophytica]
MAAAPESRHGLSGRRVAVIGGTSGIGAAVGARFAELGARVTLGGLDTAAVPAGLADTAEVVELDVTSPEDVTRFFERFDQLAVLVNAAGVIRRGEEYDLPVFGAVLDVNLVGSMRSCVAAHGALTRAGGCVVNVASMLSFTGGPLVPAYSASKGGVVSLTRSLAVAWAPDGVRVNAVAPGWITTGLTADLRADPDRDRRILDRTPMGRWGTPSEVAGAVTFLAGPDATFITGAVLPVDGGYLAA